MAHINNERFTDIPGQCGTTADWEGRVLVCTLDINHTNQATRHFDVSYGRYFETEA